MVVAHRAHVAVEVVIPSPREGFAWTLQADSADPARTGELGRDLLPVSPRSIVVLTETPAAPNATEADWDRFRLSLGLPDGSRDMEAEKSVLLEGGFDELNGVSWTKGCYMGQELTARTKYRGLLKRRLVPVRIDGTAPAPGTPLLAEGRDVGTMRSAAGEIGMAVVRLDAMDQVLTADGARVTPVVPAWMRMTEV